MCIYIYIRIFCLNKIENDTIAIVNVTKWKRVFNDTVFTRVSKNTQVAKERIIKEPFIFMESSINGS